VGGAFRAVEGTADGEDAVAQFLCAEPAPGEACVEIRVAACLSVGGGLLPCGAEEDGSVEGLEGPA